MQPKTIESIVKEIMLNEGIGAFIRKVTDINEIMSYCNMLIFVLMINEKVKNRIIPYINIVNML